MDDMMDDVTYGELVAQANDRIIESAERMRLAELKRKRPLTYARLVEMGRIKE